jgi:hypothetical protein
VLTTRGRLVRTRCPDGGSSPSVYVTGRTSGDGHRIVLALSYIAADDGGETIRTELGELVSLAQHFGGCRWMFRCRGCSRCVRALYLPPGGARFACRRCHGLTWRSVQAPGRDRARRFAEALTNLAADLYSPNALRRLKASVGIELLAKEALAGSVSR